MRLSEVLAPLSLEDLKSKYFGKKCVVKVAKGGNSLESLVTLEQIETRLNDGVASLHNLAIIDADGVKLPPDSLHCPQPQPVWNQAFLRKGLVAGLLNQGHSFVMHNMTHLSVGLGELIGDLESAFPGHQADAHIYVSPKAGSRSYNVHKDEPQHKLYLQVHGTTEWTVYRGVHPERVLSERQAEECLDVDFQATLTPGSVLYMPPGVFHRAKNPHGPRVSVSIPFYDVPQSLTIDRTHIPLRKIMNDG